MSKISSEINEIEKCPLIEEWWYIHAIVYYYLREKNFPLPFKVLLFGQRIKLM